MSWRNVNDGQPADPLWGGDVETQREGTAVALLVFQSRTGLNEWELHQEISACVLPSSFLESSSHFSF